jgi:hypothetical protein
LKSGEVPPATTDATPSSDQSSRNRTIGIAAGVSSLAFLSLVCVIVGLVVVRRRRYLKNRGGTPGSNPGGGEIELKSKNPEEDYVGLGDKKTDFHGVGSISDQLHGMVISIPELKNISISKRLGGGNFGDVFRKFPESIVIHNSVGVWDGGVKVALKKLHDIEEYKEFMREAGTLL